MKPQRKTDAPYTDALVWNEDATNDDLITHTLTAARIAGRAIVWPEGVDKARAGRIAHAFAQQAVRYVREDGDQLTRMPWRTLADGRGDCKSLSVLVAALALAAGRSVGMRYVQYAGDDHYGHVYAVVDGAPCDPELGYGQEVSYWRKLDITP